MIAYTDYALKKYLFSNLRVTKESDFSTSQTGTFGDMNSELGN